MSDFSSLSETGQPTWTAITAATNTFVPLSSASFTIILTGGYGEGTYGGGLYGEGDGSVITYNTPLGTTWTAVTDK